MSETIGPSGDQSKWKAPQPAPGERARAARERHAAKTVVKKPEAVGKINVNEQTSQLWATDFTRRQEDKAAETRRVQEVDERIRVAEAEKIRARTEASMEKARMAMLERRAALEKAERVADGVKLVEAPAMKSPEVGVEERERQELLDEVFDNGGFALWASLPREYTKASVDGFGTATDKRIMVKTRPRTDIDKRQGEELARQGVNEAVVLRPVTTDVRENRVEKKGFLGIGRKEKNVKVGDKPVKHSDWVKDGVNEPLFEISYSTLDLPGEDSRYQDKTHRFGQKMTMTISLPESVARKAFEAAKKDPSIMRTLLEQSSRDNHGISENDWKTGAEHNNNVPIRPPFEKWAEMSGGESKMFFRGPEDDVNSSLQDKIVAF